MADNNEPNNNNDQQQTDQPGDDDTGYAGDPRETKAFKAVIAQLNDERASRKALEEQIKAKAEESERKQLEEQNKFKEIADLERNGRFKYKQRKG